ncbi:MAG: hypothetical protein IPM35_23595 [Myxococcales bacterium]|nr:hypothetical protein [Myxococcales bacterium]
MTVDFAQQVPASLQLVPVAGAPAQLPLGAPGGSVQLEPARRDARPSRERAPVFQASWAAFSET